jgi:hypothetical protein
MPPTFHFLKIHDNILPSTPRSSKWSLSLMFPHQNPIYVSLLPQTYYTPRPSHSSPLDHRTILSSSLCSFLYFVTSSVLGTNILISTLFSNTLSLRSSLNVIDQVSYPYKTTFKIIVLRILIFVFFYSKLEEKRFCTEW